MTRRPTVRGRAPGPALHRSLRSRVTAAGRLEVWLEATRTPTPGPEEVLIRVEAAPVNPSDIWQMFGPADLSTLRRTGTVTHPVITAAVPRDRLALVTARLGQALLAGNEGAGTVVAAGTGARRLLGKRVAAMGGGMYSELRLLPAADCLELPDGIAAQDAAAALINPMTVLSMVECLRREGHSALVHTAAASNLGHMLQRVCLADGIPLVNVVRRPEQAAELRGLGAPYVVDSSSPRFPAELGEAVAATGATLAFDAVGGGTLANAILHAMEAASSHGSPGYSAYGSERLKRVYVYGSLDRGPTVLDRGYGMAWSAGGFLMPWFLRSLPEETVARMRERVIGELDTTFASRYAGTVSLSQALDPDVVLRYARRSTGAKYLISPSSERSPAATAAAAR